MSNKEQEPSQNNNAEDSETERKLNFGELVGSAMAAGLGVQSSKNRERDFKHGKISVFVVTGIIFTLIFIATIYTIVHLVI